MNKSKSILGVFIAFALCMGSGSASALAESHILLNDKDTVMSSNQLIKESTTLVPLKSLASEMGYALVWDQKSKTAKLVRPEREVVFTVSSTTSKVNDSILSLSKSPRIIKGSVYVPLVSAVSALGGKAIYNNSDGNIHIVDEPRFTVASVQGRSYWVSQKNGDLYYRDSLAGKPVQIGKIPFIDSPYNHAFEITKLGNGTDLLQLIDSHYAMFTDMVNNYQVLVQAGTILKQMDFHLNTPSYIHEPQLKTTQLFMTDGQNVQYINQDGSLGKLFELEKLTEHTGTFTVEYAEKDLVLVRLNDNTQLFAINIATEEVTNLSELLISSEDRKDWDRADGSDRYILSKMLVLKKRDGNILTFNYTPVIGGNAKKVTYTLKSK